MPFRIIASGNPSVTKADHVLHLFSHFLLLSVTMPIMRLLMFLPKAFSDRTQKKRWFLTIMTSGFLLTFWPEAQEVLMAQPVLEMSEHMRFTKPCIK